ncbi:MAG: dicarboxylate/amino acid:cation symporter [Bacteroidetes bacterium HGW-Bacteroidetes-9]|jgi:Na+/H+-dicarboxylate symporter|nr:MAG: dicarboxylate/amino acid:cation symporter [Bacteroidetes bacterium HGW-Bacteroidetes-9]
MKKPELHWQILIALIAGIVFAVYFHPYVSWVSWMGTLFLQLLKMVIIPLIFSSIVSGVGGIGSPENLGRLGLKTVLYYFFTSLMAILVGLLLVNTLSPGTGIDLSQAKAITELPAADQSIGQILFRAIPENIFGSLTNGDMLPIIFFAMTFGFFTNMVKPQFQKPILGFFNAVFEVMMKITLAVIKLTPFGVFAIMATVISQYAGDNNAMLKLFSGLGIYMITVITGLLIHSMITLPATMWLTVRANPWKHFRNMSTPLLTAFSTSSSSATLPLTIEAVENKDGVSNKISSFTLPLGATINMDGTALYECVAAIFIAQAYGIDLTFLQQLTIVLTALLAAVGSAGIPMAGLVMMTIVLNAVGLPLEGIGLVLAVDRILDMFRTTVNVFGDTCGAAVIAKSEGETLNV